MEYSNCEDLGLLWFTVKDNDAENDKEVNGELCFMLEKKKSTYVHCYEFL